MGILHKFLEQATQNFIPALKSSPRWSNLTSQAPRVLFTQAPWRFLSYTASLSRQNYEKSKQNLQKYNKELI